ncbi:methylthioribose-1-phosphate isomerase [hydrocarbon metagenome]|uniref:Methylthioribose-1-phosphate isomerase n=1 Tax=hydrocarbon metagenome TaxID=938273 RepID=A0A0W8E390_9ZZZZ
MIKTIYFEGNTVMLLDQSRLPEALAYERCKSSIQVAEAIKKLKVRGAPLIGVAAAFGLAMEINNYRGPAAGLDEHFRETKKLLASTRPTAVNLFWALERMERTYQANQHEDPIKIAQVLLDEAEKMFEEDININKAIGEYGQEIVEPESNIMTICNAGALATCGYGTALGVIRSAAGRGKLKRVWACETRPVLQGARLTVWELLQDHLPVSLITDSMAGYTMKLGHIDVVIVGADRIAANGDVANKIGTFSLAVLANYNHIPFYVAAPLSTVDLSIETGLSIPIEERHQDEVRQIAGSYMTVPEVEVFNPAFDVTPHDLISGIITEKGIIRPSYVHGLEKAKKDTRG